MSPPLTVRGDERGSGLILALLFVVIVSAMAAAVLMVSRTETLVAAHFRTAAEALFAAEGGIAQAVRDLAAQPDWDLVLSGAVTSSLAQGTAIGSQALPAGGSIVLCCGPASLTGSVQLRADGGRGWGLETPQWVIYAWGPVTAWGPAGAIQSPLYVAVWVSDDPADGDGDPYADNNGVLRVHAQALGPSGSRRIVEAVVHRPWIGSPPAPAPGVRVGSWREVRW